MALRPTKRRNGLMMATLQVRFTVAANWLVKAVQQDMSLDDGRKDYTRSQIEGVLRHQLLLHGEALLQQENDEEFEEAAWAIVRRAYPEMCGGGK